MWGEIANAFREMDIYIYFMFGLWTLGMIVMFERMFVLQFRYNLDFNKFLTNLKKMIKAEDFDRAINHCRSTSDTSLPYITMRAIEAAETDPSTVRGVIDEETINFLPRIERGIAALPAFATLILLIGVLGTINALFAAFHSIDVLDTTQKQAAIGHGISKSLVYTSFGLLVCMMFIAAHQFIKGMALRLVERIHYGVAVLTNMLAPADVAVVAGNMVAPASMPMESTVASAAPLTDLGAEAELVESAETSEVSNENDFDDAAVEDIKDEEEII